jgi:radical SAM superfamily enzyme YgiQ (UPF0313 family)
MPFVRPEIIRPPSEAASYFLPLTGGCSNASCGFCNFYGCRLQVRPLAEIKQEIDALALYEGHGIRLAQVPPIVYAVADSWDGKRIFLQDGDALSYPFDGLIEILEYLNRKFPALERIASYATPQDILRREPSELKTLKDLKLGILYMGMESGDDSVLLHIGKGVDSRQMIAAGQRIKESGIASSLTVILGLGGVEGSASHAVATARVLSQADPDFAGALTLTLVPGTPLYEENRRGSFKLVSPLQSLRELQTIVGETSLSDCLFSSMHASNYLSVRGKLSRDREKILAQLEMVVARNDPSLLKPEFLRGL